MSKHKGPELKRLCVCDSFGKRAFGIAFKTIKILKFLSEIRVSTASD